MAEIIWTIGAIDDLEEIAEYISRDSRVYASAFVSRLIGSTEKLREFPLLGRIVPEFKDKNIREVIVHNYRIVYRVQGSRICIVAVVHGSRDLLLRLKEESR